VLRFLWLLVAALAAGLTYPFISALAVPAAAVIAWKGAGVGLLAVWASLQGRSVDHRLLAAVLLLGATADLVLALHFVGGAAVFAVGHVVAMTLYRRNRRPGLGARDVAAAGLFVAGVVLLAALLASAEMALPVAVYALFLAGMAATALMSRFPLAAVGALFFVASDLLIFARMASLAGVGWVSHAVWLLYFGGQALIAWGVAPRLDDRARLG
jgi:uncharacterized membrane protein YhhN